MVPNAKIACEEGKFNVVKTIMTAMPSYLTLDPSGPSVSIDPHNAEFVQNPYAAYAALFEAGYPVFFWEEYGVWCFAGFDAVNAMFRDRRFGRQILHVATREELGWPPRPTHLQNFDAVERHSLLELEPPGHTRLRKLVNRAFVSRQVQLLRPQIEALCAQLFDGFSGETDLLAEYATPLPLTTICRLLGVPVEAGPQLLDWSHAIVKMYVLDPTMDGQLAADKASAEFAEFLRTHIQLHRQTPKDDLLSTLIAASEDGDTLSEDELISTVVVLLNAGHEATVHQLGNAVKVILDSGMDTGRLFEDNASAIATVEECLRIDPPLHMFTRYCLEDMTLEMDGASIALKKGDEIGLLLGAANHDPRKFENSTKFDPTRANQANVTFGAGIHFCIGAPLARLELQVGLKTLFDRMPELQLAEQPLYRDIFHFHGLDKIIIK